MGLIRVLARLLPLLIFLSCAMRFTMLGKQAFLKVKNTTFSMMTSIEVRSLGEMVKNTWLMENKLPPDFRAFIKQNMKKAWMRQPWQDVWLHEFRLEKTHNGFCVRSAGPDGKYLTADDIIYKDTLETGNEH